MAGIKLNQLARRSGWSLHGVSSVSLAAFSQDRTGKKEGPLWSRQKKMFLIFLILHVGYMMGAKHHYVYWNTTNPLFSDRNTPNLITVNEGNLPQEYDQLHLICPQDTKEHHVIYSVSRHEFMTCRVTNPRPEKVMVCNKTNPGQFRTITFRPFSPSPGGLEFRPGQEYFFISTATQRDIHRRVGGVCSSHNMKLTFKVSDNGENRFMNPNKIVIPEPPKLSFDIESSTPGSLIYDQAVPTVRSSDYIYYYSPRDLAHLKLAAKKHQLRNMRENNSLKAAKLSSGCSSSVTSLAALLAMLTIAIFRR